MSRVGETGVGEMGIGKTGVGEMGVGETGPNHVFFVPIQLMTLMTLNTAHEYVKIIINLCISFFYFHYYYI